MKLICIQILLILSAVISAHGQKETVKELQPAITSVVIYTEGAEVSHQFEMMYSQGRSLLKIQNLSPRIDPRGLRVNSDVGISILTLSLHDALPI